MERLVLCAWVANGWIYSRDQLQDARYWISDGWVWGPLGAADATTGYWMADGWIFGPVGSEETSTGYFIKNDWIYGPAVRLPFAPQGD